MNNKHTINFYLVSIKKSEEIRKDNINNIKNIIKKNTGKNIIQMGVDGKNINSYFINKMKNKGFFKNTQNYKYIERDGKYLSKGEIGCFLSHIGVWLDIVKKKISYAIVLEDDALIDNNFISDINNILKNKPKYFEFISLYHSTSNLQQKLIKALHPYNNYLLKISFDLHGTVGYIISFYGARNFLKKLLPINNPVDRSIMLYYYIYRNSRSGYISKKAIVSLYDNESLLR